MGITVAIAQASPVFWQTRRTDGLTESAVTLPGPDPSIVLVRLKVLYKFYDPRTVLISSHWLRCRNLWS